MTLVVTHNNGFLGCFTKEADGTMRQRALIDTGDAMATPESLALLADGLDGQWHWTTPAIAPTKRGRPKALPPAPADRAPKVVDTAKRKRVKRRGNPYGGGHPADPLPAERPTMVLAYLNRTPYQTVSEILEGIGLEPTPERNSRWHHVFTHMLKARMIERRPRVGATGPTKFEYWALKSP